jgi:DNA primase catalytic core
MIEKERIAHIKSTVDMVALAEAKGIRMKKNGKSWFGLCPFHNDKNPSFSVTPAKNEWHCFGCDKGGDVIRFVELFDQVDFKEAVNRLSDNGFKKPKEPQPSDPDLKCREYLERVVTIYEKNLEGAGMAWLKKRGITDAGLYTKYRIGFCDNTLKETLPSDKGLRDTLTQLGILFKKGTERFDQCVVFPVVDTTGRIVTLYGRHTRKTSKKHLFLPDRPTGLWNEGVLKTGSDIVLTESIMDALSVHMAGLTNVISIQGTQGLSDEHITLFKDHGIQTITLLLDGDPPGRKAALQLKKRLTGFNVDIKTLPKNHDPNSYLLKNGAKKLGEFISRNKPKTILLPGSLVIPCGQREYQIMGLEKGTRKLKATIRLEYGEKLYVDTVDLYSARSRRTLAQDICRTFEELPETIESDINHMICECEKIKDSPRPVVQEQGPVMTAQEKAEAGRFGQSENLPQRILSDFKTCGLIGEEANKLLGYVAMTSRKQKNPISVQILSSSGAGKTKVLGSGSNYWY